jgi:hypothetical protein
MSESKDLDQVVPEYYFLGAVTRSARVKSDCALFDKGPSIDTSERLARWWREAQQYSQFSLQNIEQVASILGLGTRIDFDEPNQPPGYSRYMLQYAKDAFALNLGDIADLGEWDRNWKQRNVISHVLLSLNRAPKEPTHNEFAVLSKSTGKYSNDLKVAYDLLLLLGIRRSVIFAPQMATRIFNVCLPVGRLAPRKADVQDNERTTAYQSEVSDYLVLPVVTLDAKLGGTHVRKTFSITLVLVPVTKDFDRARMVSAHELHHVYYETEFELQDSSLKEFLQPDVQTNSKWVGSAIRLLDLIWKNVYDTLVQAKDLPEQREQWQEVYNQLSTSGRAVGCILVPWLDEAVIEGFYRNNLPLNARAGLKRIADPTHHLPDESRHAFPDIIELQSMLVIDKGKINSDSLSFYNKQVARFVELICSKYESFPSGSIKWAFAWCLYMSIGISILDATIHSFYGEIASKQDAKTLVKIENDLVEDMDEFYDLEIRYLLFKEIYEALRSLAGTDQDFRMLKEKLNALKTNLLMLEQRRVNSYILALAVATAIVGIVAVLIR